MHITEWKWDQIQGRLGKQLKFAHDTVTVSAAEVVEIADDLLAEHGGDTTEAAKQLFETETPTAAQVAKVDDALAAVEGLRAMVQAAAGVATTADADRPSAMRRMRST